MMVVNSWDSMAEHRHRPLSAIARFPSFFIRLKQSEGQPLLGGRILLSARGHEAEDVAN